ncbi:MAG: aspartate-semialdehyde dehydrogenase [Candidatus Spechtbacterales bacterium]|nr:aspartate-semialdehyde dehydrogenase [Candidatus Spechtbacterales bacterium]
MTKINLAIVGATGNVGRTMLRVLEEREFPINELKLIASERSAGKAMYFAGKTIHVDTLKPDSFENSDIALFSAGSSVSRSAAPLAVGSGCFVVDNSNAWRMEQNVPLIVPEVNPLSLPTGKEPRIIANPNCSTIQMAVALWPIHQKAGLKRIVVSTYQAVSGTGKKALEELHFQSGRVLNVPEKELDHKVYPHQIAFNCLPHIDEFLEDGYTKEEMKMVNETRKIFNTPLLPISATCVRVPVFNGHAESINIETNIEITPEDARKVLNDAPGVKVVDDPENNQYPMQITANGIDEVLVGRIRKDNSVKNGLNIWVVADNLRKGAATNTVQIAQLLLKKSFK